MTFSVTQRAWSADPSRRALFFAEITLAKRIDKYRNFAFASAIWTHRSGIEVRLRFSFSSQVLGRPSLPLGCNKVDGVSVATNAESVGTLPTIAGLGKARIAWFRRLHR